MTVVKYTSKKKVHAYPLVKEIEMKAFTDVDAKLLTHKSTLVAQQVTSRHKPPTLIVKKKGNVYKGPYKLSQPNAWLVWERQRFFTGSDCDAFVSWDFLLDEKTQCYYLVSKDLAKASFVYPSHNSTYLPKNHPDHKEKRRCVISEKKEISQRKAKGRCRRDEGGVSTARNEIAIKGYLPDSDWKPLLYHFLLRYVKLCGDSGLWNVINGKGIDFEDVRKLKVPVTCLYDTLFSKGSVDSVTKRKIVHTLKQHRDWYLSQLQERAIPLLDAEGDINGWLRASQLVQLFTDEKYE